MERGIFVFRAFELGLDMIEVLLSYEYI
jgi:hypothetical protein